MTLPVMDDQAADLLAALAEMEIYSRGDLEGYFRDMFGPNPVIDVDVLTVALRQHRDIDQRFTPPLVTDEVTGRSRYATSSEFAADIAESYRKELRYRAGNA